MHGVVDRLLRIGSAVENLVARLLQRRHDGALQRVPRVVESGGDSHGPLTIAKGAAAAPTIYPPAAVAVATSEPRCTSDGPRRIVRENGIPSSTTKPPTRNALP